LSAPSAFGLTQAEQYQVSLGSDVDTVYQYGSIHALRT